MSGTWSLRIRSMMSLRVERQARAPRPGRRPGSGARADVTEHREWTAPSTVSPARAASQVHGSCSALLRGLDDDQRVAVWIAGPEHRRHRPAVAADLVVDVDACLLQRRMIRVDVRRIETDAGLA